MAVQMLGIKTKFTDDQGRPLVGGKVHAYFAGTTTYQDTFKDPDMTIVNTNPIILDDSGSADVYLNGSYRIRIFDKNDVLIEEQDGVTQSTSGEITTAKGEIIGLYGAVLNSLTNEVKRAVAAEKTIADSLTSETTRAKAAESALQSSIDAEAVRAKAAESDLNADIIKEVSDRESEVTRLDEADAVLQAQINSVGGGKLAYKTYAEMIADESNIAAKSSIDVIADTDDKNGTYLYDGTNFVKSQYDIEKIIRAKVQNTFGTYAQMVASNLSDGAYALVADDAESDNNGLYVKAAGAWVKSQYLQGLAPQTNDILKEYEYYSPLKEFVSISVDSTGTTRVLQVVSGSSITDYTKSNQEENRIKNIIAGDNVSIIESESEIEISAGIVNNYATPYEFNTCLLIGQSNSSTYGGDALKAPELPEGVCYVWDYNLNKLVDITSSEPIAETYKKTYIPSIALEYFKQTGKGLIAVLAGKGSTSQLEYGRPSNEHWDTGSTLRETAVSRYKDCVSYAENLGMCVLNGFYVWSQGENDGGKIESNESTKEEYKAGFKRMVDFFRDQLPPKMPFLIVRTGSRTTGDIDGWRQVRDAQMEASSEFEGVYMGYSAATTFIERGMMGDNLHYGQEGKNEAGVFLARNAAHLTAGVN